jgi:hypothetical protein
MKDPHPQPFSQKEKGARIIGKDSGNITPCWAKTLDLELDADILYIKGLVRSHIPFHYQLLGLAHFSSLG